MPIQNWAPWGRAVVELIRVYVNTPGADTRSPEYMADLAREVYNELMRECGLCMVRLDRERTEC